MRAWETLPPFVKDFKNGISLGKTRGQLAGDLAREFFDQASERQKRAIGWDVPQKERRERIAGCLEYGRAISFFAWVDKCPAAFAWLVPYCKGAKVAVCHFSFVSNAGPETALDIGKIFLKLARRYFADLVAVIPCRWFGAIAYVKQLGLVEVCRLKGAAWLADYDRNVDALMFIRKL